MPGIPENYKSCMPRLDRKIKRQERKLMLLRRSIDDAIEHLQAKDSDIFWSWKIRRILRLRLRYERFSRTEWNLKQKRMWLMGDIGRIVYCRADCDCRWHSWGNSAIREKIKELARA